MPKKASFAQVLSDKLLLHGGRLLLNCNKISLPWKGKRANFTRPEPKFMSFPRRRESMGALDYDAIWGLNWACFAPAITDLRTPYGFPPSRE